MFPDLCLCRPGLLKRLIQDDFRTGNRRDSDRREIAVGKIAEIPFCIKRDQIMLAGFPIRAVFHLQHGIAGFGRMSEAGQGSRQGIEASSLLPAGMFFTVLAEMSYPTLSVFPGDRI